MKAKQLFSVFTISFIVLFSCKEKITSSENKVNKSNIVVLKKSELTIKGMTCEIGCAKLIQSKLAKTKGVKFVEVNFKDNTAMVEYDENKLNINTIKSVITNIAGGDLYSVTDNKEVTQFSHLKETNIK